MRRRKHLLLFVPAEAALIVCGVLATVCSIPTSFKMPFELAPIAIAASVLALIFVFAFRRAKKWWIPAIVFFLLILFFTYKSRTTVTDGAKLAWYYSADVLSLTFSFLPTPVLPEDIADPQFSVTVFLIYEAVALTFVTAILVVKCKSPIPALILPIPALIPCFIYTDCIPALYTVALLVIYWVGVLFGRELLKKLNIRTGVGRFVSIVLLAVLALLVPLLSPQTRYTPIPYSERKDIIDAFGKLKDRLLFGEMLSQKEYDLNSEGYREEIDSKAFSICCTTTGNFTLRMHSYGRYGGNTWKEAQEYDGSWNSMQALGNTQRGDYEYMYIREAYSVERITPYAFLQDDQVTVGESSIRANGRSAYTWLFMPEIRFVQAERDANEDRYYRFALEEYTLHEGHIRDNLLTVYDKLLASYETESPEDTPSPDASETPTPDPEAFLEETGFETASPSPDAEGQETGEETPSPSPDAEEQETGEETPSPSPDAEEKKEDEAAPVIIDKNDPYGTALRIADLVRRSGTYALNPGRNPAGTDFVDFFLTRSHNGYCVHFASSTTALLQAHGIPARYVVGYRVQINEVDTWIEVPKKAAHAWTEVYIKGVGWVPVESSAGFPDGCGYVPDDSYYAVPATEEPEHTPSPLDDYPPEPDITPRPTKSPVQIPTPDPNATPTPAPDDNDNSSGAWKLWLPLGILGTIIVWEAVGAVIRARRKRRFNQEDSRAAVLEMLKYLGMLREYGASTPDNSKALALEAAFSNHPMKDEQKQLLELVRKNAAAVCSGQPLMRFFLRWIVFRI